MASILEYAKLPERTGPTGEKRRTLNYRPPSPRRDKKNTRDRLRHTVWKAQKFLYRYDHIESNQVRLMALQASQDFEGDLVADLVTIPIEKLKDFPYEALSYHWGESQADNPIYVHSANNMMGGMSHMSDVAAMVSMRLYVKDNLYEALRHLRDKNHAIILWADGLCMDQGNEVEKGAQVPNMATIYSCATRVCVWLGLADQHGRTDRAMSFIPKIVTEDIDSLILPDQAKNWRDLIFLMRCSWFSRRWIIQELALAKEATVRCGSKEVDWRDFSDAVSLFDLNFQKIRKLFGNKPKDYIAIAGLGPLGAKILVDELSNTFLRAADQSPFEPIKTLETLVSTLSTFETTDPRDTIYSFLNIARDTSTKFGIWIPSSSTQVQPPTPEYTHDLLMVYTDFVRYVVDSSKSLDILCRQWALPERKETKIMYETLVELPSWIKTVPESPFGKQGEGFNGRKNGDNFVGLPNAKIYNASRDKPPEVRFGMAVRESINFPDSPTTNSLSTGTIPTVTKTSHRNGDLIPNSNPASPNGLSPTESHFSDGLGSATSTSTRRPSLRSNDRPRTPAEERQRLRDRDPSIYVKGFILSTVTWKTDPIPDGIIPKGALQRLGWSNRDDEVFLVPDRVWRTLVADRGPDGRPPPSWYHRASLRCLVQDTPNGHISTKNILEQNSSGIMYDYIRRVQAVTWNRVVLEGIDENNPKENLVGIGPPLTEMGDLICIIFGCSVPCIIRPWMFTTLGKSSDINRRKPDISKGEQPDYYEFIGEAFIYGKMDGQAIDSISPKVLQTKTREFRLR
ncbi:heterokaryon incompatibility protein-domain-containing protein [Annulohypoxylon maeteangense]|uniref:heterokaryon incompatibility protein-domain-containing protein n=1 Tax=Annulohypoxylon maeteangense TaxID=1927788 RepID=UPI0020073F3D|nr:heterokaryon incompatibility protein-domain-containing protein [Annulohypoxylon maeteangense]KAI0884889.1 heterokaryon incompatibility protein-domain-containing protein [Annulohypoxylon maeteangense]